MWKLRVAGVIFLSNLLTLRASGNISEFIRICDVNDPELNNCARSSLKGVLKSLSQKELPQFKLPYLNPLRVTAMSLDQGVGLLGLTAHFTDTRHYGFDKLTVLSARVDPRRYFMEFDIFVPDYTMVGSYDCTGRIIFLPIYGTGPCNLSVFDSKVRWTLEGRPKMKKNTTYMNLRRFQVKVRPSGGRFYFGNLFDGGVLGFISGDDMNKILTDNSKAVLSQMATTIDDTFGQLFYIIAKQFLDKVPYKELFRGL